MVVPASAKATNCKAVERAVMTIDAIRVARGILGSGRTDAEVGRINLRRVETRTELFKMDGSR